jgi:spore coat protein U-like protein
MRREFLLLALFCLPSDRASASGCTLTGNGPTVSATAIAFGGYSATQPAPTLANGSVQIRCPLGIGLLPSFDIALSAGNGGGFLPRSMQSGANRLDYNIYTSAAYASIWGDGTGGTVTQSYTSLLALGTITFTTYGRIPANRFAAPGTYIDTIRVTVTY